MSVLSFKALYYPYARCTNPNTLKRALLLFDEIWFIDPTSDRMREGLITDGRDIPHEIISEWDITRKAYELLLEKNIVHLYDPEELILKNDSLLSTALKADIEDTSMWELFAASGRPTWSMLRRRVPPSAFDYLISQGPGRITYGTETALGQTGFGGDDSYYFFTDGKVKFQRDNYGKRGKIKREKEAEFTCLFPYTHGSSLAVNQAILVAEELNLIPLTDSLPHQKFLDTKHHRLLKNLEASDKTMLAGVLPPNPEKLRRVALTVFDSLISETLLERISFEEALEFREKSKESMERFKLYIADLTMQIGTTPWDDKYEEEIKKIIYNKVLPEAQKAQDAYVDIWSSLFGKISKRMLVALAPSVILTVFTGISVPVLLSGGLATLGGLAPDIIEAIIERQKVKRNSLTYLIQLQGKMKDKR